MNFLEGPNQRTLAKSITVQGVGLHSGRPVRLTLRPSSASTGIQFRRVDLPNQPWITAIADNVLDTKLSTRIGTPEASVATIEHFMAACFGMGIDNLIIEIDGPEVPILDGSALPFLVLFDEAGIIELPTPRRILQITKALEIVDPKDPTRFIRIEPSDTACLSYVIDFPNISAIGRQSVSVDLSGSQFCKDLAYARTFGNAEEYAWLRNQGLALGASFENAIAVTKSAVLNTQGLRSPTEFVRHKALDCVGDLLLTGSLIIGHIVVSKAGHDLHTALARKLLTQAQELMVGVETRRLPSAQSSFAFPLSIDAFRKHLELYSQVAG